MSDELDTINAQEQAAIKAVFVKAAGDYELDVLGVPFGGPDGGKDSDGEYFAKETQLHLDKLTPLVMYYHGIEPDGKTAQKLPEVIGSVTKHWTDERGHWFRVVLDKASEYARRIWDAAKRGLARASSGSVAHLVRKDADGKIINWPMAELALIDAEGKRQPANSYAVAVPALKSIYEKSGKTIPDFLAEQDAPEADNSGASEASDTQAPDGAENNMEGNPMSEELDTKIAEALARYEERQAAKAKEAADKQAEIDAAVKAALDKRDAEDAKTKRLPTPYVRKFQEIDRYENLTPGQAYLAAAVLKSAGKPVSEALMKACAVKALEDKTDPEPRQALKAAGFAGKSDEVMQQDLTSYGDEWVMAGYSGDLWRSIRDGGRILPRVPQVEIPMGVESMKYVLESTDPTWYKVSETTDEDSTMKTPVASITSSKVGTANQTLSLGKIGVRSSFSGELEEDSIVPILAQIRDQFILSGQEVLEHILIDGDIETSSGKNINDIDSEPAGTEPYLVLDGFRKLALVTNTANSRSAAGGFVIEDYLETIKLMGTDGLNADPNNTAFIVPGNTWYASMKLPEVKTRDVNSAAAIESGRLARMYGYEVYPSRFMHKMSTARLANSSGKVDQGTTTNNAYGAILAVNFSQWKFGWKRRMKLETTRIARADVTEVVATMRFGLIYRDTEASAITYYVGV